MKRIVIVLASLALLVMSNAYTFSAVEASPIAYVADPDRGEEVIGTPALFPEPISRPALEPYLEPSLCGGAAGGGRSTHES